MSDRHGFRRLGWRGAFICGLSMMLIGSGLGMLTPVRADDEDERDRERAQRFFVQSTGGGAYLGVNVEEELDLEEGGARITRVVDGSPAEEAGLRVGDVIIGFADRTVRGPGSLTRAIGRVDPGEEVALRIMRNGRERTIDLELADRAEMSRSYAVALGGGDSQELAERYREWGEQFGQQWEEWGERFGEEFAIDMESLTDSLANVQVLGDGTSFMVDRGSVVVCDEGDCRSIDTRTRPRLGVYLVETTAELRQHMGGSEDEGVLVSRVVEDSAAAEAGVEVGDLILSVDGEPVKNSRELRRALRDVAGRTVEVVIARDGRERRLQATFPEVEDRDGRGPRAELRDRPSREAYAVARAQARESRDRQRAEQHRARQLAGEAQAVAREQSQAARREARQVLAEAQALAHDRASVDRRQARQAHVEAMALAREAQRSAATVQREQLARMRDLQREARQVEREALREAARAERDAARAARTRMVRGPI